MSFDILSLFSCYFSTVNFVAQGLRELLGISAKNQSLPPTKKAAVGVDQAIQTEVRLEEEDEQCRSGIELEVTLPMPAPPPRLNRGSSTAAAAAGQTTQAKTSPAEDDTGITGIVYVY